MDTEEILKERGSKYGEFPAHAEITWKLKMAFRDHNFQKLSVSHKEALDMIAHKIGRILNGDPDYQDSWDDIAGYAKLASKACKVDR